MDRRHIDYFESNCPGKVYFHEETNRQIGHIQVLHRSTAITLFFMNDI
jgi:hypothetical protein